MNLTKPGLDGVEVAETHLSLVNGQEGLLVVCGRRLEELGQLSLEQMAELLWQHPVDFGHLRMEAYQHLKPLFPSLASRQPKEAVRLGLAGLPSKASPELVAASLPVILAAGEQGAKLASPDPELGQVEDFLRLFDGQTASPERVAALSTYLATVAEHGMNASTFCCRVVASTRATPVESVVAAYGALCGPLHGGAPGPVLNLLDELRNCEDKRALLLHKVRKGERLMGFGHRVYKTRDPRAEALKAAVGKLSPSETLREAEEAETIAQEVLQELKPGRSLFTNVEFYTAVLLHELGFHRDWFTPLFATGRVLGWMAHYLEQQREGRLMRPKARYLGPLPKH